MFQMSKFFTAVSEKLPKIVKKAKSEKSEIKKSIEKPKKLSKATLKRKPMEVSSRRAVEPPRPTFTLIKREKARDPRFDEISGGEFSATKCAQAYSFLEDMRQDERNRLIIAKGGKSVKNEEIDEILKKMDSQDRARKRLSDFNTARVELLQGERSKVEETGKTPYFHSTKEIRAKVLEKRFDSLKKSGKVDAEIAKHRKHAASKERKNFLPMQRRVVQGE